MKGMKLNNNAWSLKNANDKLKSNLLSRVSDINKKYEQVAKITGENFNIFSILGLTSAENSHSLFIADLLNPAGSHLQGELYLKLFLTELGFSEHFEHLNLATVTTEKYIGDVANDYSEGGRIDIFIEHPTSNIIIENKIYAGDQFQQLYRYYQYSNKINKKATILYLTLDGVQPSKESLGELSIESISCVSYRENILNWLEKCIAKSATLPTIRETIIQYRNIIRQLTNQCNNQNKETEIMDIILSSEENFNTAKQIAEVMNNIDKAHDKVLNFIRNKFKNKYGASFFKLCKFKDYSINLQVMYGENNQGNPFQIGVVPLLNDKWGHQTKFDWTTIEECNVIYQALHKYLERAFKKDVTQINGYCSNNNYICRIPFGTGENGQSYLFHKPSMTYEDYKWLADPDNQEKLAQYSFDLCDEIIQLLKNNLKETDVEFLI